ncbi:hypothetical protein E2C01_091561 [Portunus trituberculatus]|uniref:Uncharacterized protein n=1 Tax=Portunus trituberculatus TaxID=210409 RepID=A0A5B7JHU5_PORTR|nr:hypothetical protein [Portunus trituberculatus]
MQWINVFIPGRPSVLPDTGADLRRRVSARHCKVPLRPDLVTLFPGSPAASPPLRLPSSVSSGPER